MKRHNNWRNLFEPEPNGLSSLRAKLDRVMEDEKREKLVIGGFALALAGLLGIV